VSPGQPIRVVVGEDQPFVREGIVRVLTEGGFEVAGTAADARELVRVAAASRPDVIIADIQMPPGQADDGLRAALAARAAHPATGVLVLSQFLEDAYAFDLVADGAQGVGYLLKEKVGDLRVFTDAVRRVAEGGSVLDPDVVARLVGRQRKAGPLDGLTRRERQVLGLIAEGRSNTGIAQELVVTVAAVERHVTSIFDKLGLNQAADVHRRVLAVLTYLGAWTASRNRRPPDPPWPRTPPRRSPAAVPRAAGRNRRTSARSGRPGRRRPARWPPRSRPGPAG
jgi:DNA-binding NarL/FixJ family response regulator